jgi:hypothetical protein
VVPCSAIGINLVCWCRYLPSLALFNTVPSIVVEESEMSSLSVPRPAHPSLDLTQMRHAMGAGYSPTSPSFSGSDRLLRSDDGEQGSGAKSWSNIGAPGSQISTSAVDSELYVVRVHFLTIGRKKWMRMKRVKWYSLCSSLCIRVRGVVQYIDLLSSLDGQGM